jgi:Mycothiol maleylpyruvate isomerase N-terminal domain
MDGKRIDELAASYNAISRVGSRLDARDFLRVTRCVGWAVCDLLFHVLLDAQRALIAFATPAEGPADVDFVSYWEPFSSEDADSLAHARFVRISASAHSSPRHIASRWQQTALAAVHAADAAPADGFIARQGHVLTVPDFIKTLIVEAVIHYLDLVVDLPRVEAPDAAALSVVRATLDGLLGQPPPPQWDDATYALKATGREPLTDGERLDLGKLAGRLPVFS